ncbi:pseudoazurin [Constrictibacter sp. MBR-5]|jgi:pseudoazurin|uniref:pseudoazurin n=1 Tax=Constrictibacter sp. MBR-5 TaxID=3156467 RepID=UPI0033990012
MLKTLLMAAGVAALLAGGPGAAAAADHEVKMLNRGAAGMMVFEPPYLKVAPGDTVTFKSVNPSHNAETIPGMLPEGAQAFKGALSKDLTVTFEKEGIYGYKCMPHYGMGMVGVIQVGDDTGNADAAKAVKHPGKANKVMAALIAKTGTSVAAVK